MFKQMRLNLKFLTTIFSLTLLVSGFFVFNRVEASGPYNGNITGHVGASGLAVTGNTAGDITTTISGALTEYSNPGQKVSFEGTISGDINGTLIGGVNYNGHDTLFAEVTGSDATGYVYLIGDFQGPNDGDFVGRFLTQSNPIDLISNFNITAEGNATSVNVRDTLQFHSDFSNVYWDIYINDYSKASINHETGLLTGNAVGSVTVIASALDGSLVTKNYDITITPDTATPKVTSVSHTGNSAGGKIIYNFDEPVQLMDHDKIGTIPASEYATNLGIYELTDYSTPENVTKVGQIQSAELSLDGKTMIIAYTGNLEGITDMQYVVDAWGNNITDLAGNKMVADADTQKFIVKAEAPVIESSIHDTYDKTITYTFSEPIKFVKQSDSTTTQDPNGLVKIYKASDYAALDDIVNQEPTRVDTSNTANYNQSTGKLVITYTGVIPAGKYLADTWGYTVTDLEGNKLDESNQNALFDGDNIPPTATVIQTGDSVGGTITYTFNEPVKLMNWDKSADLDSLTYKDNLAIYEFGAYSTHAVGIEPDHIGNIDSATLSPNGKTMIIVYTGNLEGIEDMQYVVDAWGNNITDLAGNKMVADADTQAFIVEAEAPVVESVNDSTLGIVTYNLNEPVQLRNSAGIEILPAQYAKSLGIYDLDEYVDYVSHSNVDVPTKKGNITKATLNDSKTTLTIEYSGTPVKHDSTYYIVDAWGSNITDLAGNKMVGDVDSQKFTIEGDSTSPLAGALTMSTKLHSNITVEPSSGIYTVTTPLSFNGVDVFQALSVVVTDDNLNTESAPVFINTVENGEMVYDSTAHIWKYSNQAGAPSFEEGSQTITATFKDNAGNTTPLTLLFTTDITAPIITLTPSTTNLTNQTVIVDATINEEGTLNENSHEFTYYGQDFDFIATDTAGNIATRHIQITNVDNIPPVITLTGANPQIIEVKNDYVELGSTMSDNLDPLLTVDIDSSSVDTSIVGSYEVKYNVTDTYGNAAEKIRTVNVVDTTKPVISTHENITREATSADGEVVTYTLPTATDNYDTSVSVSCLPTTGSTFPIGETIINCNAADINGNEGLTTFKVIIEDTTAPTITLLGDPQTVEVKSAYVDPKATFYDAVDGTFEIRGNTKGVNTNTVGEFTFTYTAADEAGNVSTPVKRTVTVVDTQKPTISTQENITSEATSSAGAVVTYTTPTATDNYDTSVSVSCSKASGSTFKLGTTTVTCTVTDTSNNSIYTSFDVTVQDTTKPVITLTGLTPITIYRGNLYTDAGATVTDNYDEEIEITSEGKVDTSIAGTYTITYNATDSIGNTAIPVVRTINVVRAPSSGGSRLAVEPALPAQNIEGCKSGELFNTLTGKSCELKATPANPNNQNEQGQVLGAEKFNFTLLLKIGSKGNEVTELQKFLNAAGYDCGTADGVFGQKTKAAVIKFQIVNKLVGDGIVGALTRAVLNK